MPRANVDEFLLAALDDVADLPPELAERLEAILKQQSLDRARAIRQLFEELAGDD
jgi:hypothetical protein